MPTTTTNIGLLKPLVNDATDADTWGDDLNDNMDTLDAFASRVQIPFSIRYPEAATYTLVLKSRVPLTIQSITTKTDAGTLTANVKINSTSVTSLSAISVTSSEATTTATGANSLAAGDDLVITLTSVSGVAEFAFNIWALQTAAGTA